MSEDLRLKVEQIKEQSKERWKRETYETMFRRSAISALAGTSEKALFSEGQAEYIVNAACCIGDLFATKYVERFCK